MACSLFCAISSRARSMRALRSSTVIGTAWPFIDFRLAIAGGNFVSHSVAEMLGTTATAAAVAPVCRKRRRENCIMAVECIARLVSHEGQITGGELDSCDTPEVRRFT